MPFVQGFDNDIFISYGHADNSEGWVDNFEKRLGNRLRHFGRNAEIAIWRDHKLSGADIFTEKIYKHIKSSALLISILSPNGVESNWCQQERQRFEQAAPSTGGFRLGDHAIRALKVVKTPLDGDGHRQVFSETLGYEFYRPLPTGRFVEFHPGTPEFDLKLDELAQEVWDLLRRLRDRAVSPPPDLAIYLATATADLSNWREAAARQLIAWNCRVLPDLPLPIASPALRDSIVQALEPCALSVHFAGSKPGFIAEDETGPVDVLQLEIARAHGVGRVVCQAAALHPAMSEMLQKEQQRGFEECLKPAGIDVLLQCLEDRVRSLRASPARDSALPTVYVVCAPSEWDDALRLKNCIESEGRYAALLPIRDVDDERLRLRHHREDMKASDAVVVYWGQAGEPWFRDQYRELIGARSKRRRALPALCLSAQADPRREHYRRPDLPFEHIVGLNCASFRHLFRHLEPNEMSGRPRGAAA